MTYRGAEFTEMDLDAVLARRPEVALVDELAHTNVPGSRNAKRWQDIAGAARRRHRRAHHGQHPAPGVAQRRRRADHRRRRSGRPCPTRWSARAEQVELVDMTPEALRRRMAHGNIYRPEKIDAALGNYFRVGNLTALRELALLWLADKVDEQLDRYRAEHDIDATWEARERVVVALTGGPEGDTLIRRAARIAARSKGADLLAVHVARNDGLAGADPAQLARQRVLVESLGGTYHQVVGADVPTRAARLRPRRQRHPARARRQPPRPVRAALLRRASASPPPPLSGSIDVHLVTHEQAGQGRRRRGRAGARCPAAGGSPASASPLLGLPLLTAAAAAAPRRPDR